MFCLFLSSCAKPENDTLHYGNTMSELIESELDEKTVET